jgi:hypothetical protein
MLGKLEIGFDGGVMYLCFYYADCILSQVFY